MCAGTYRLVRMLCDQVLMLVVFARANADGEASLAIERVCAVAASSLDASR